MPQIKRYPNRKLYDTEAKRYVTLQDISQMIRNGQEVHVVDYESGEDLTNLTLTQIIVEQEKRNASGLVPRFLLTSIIRAGGDRLSDVRRSLEAASESASDDFETVREQADAAIEQGQQMIDQMQALLRIDERMADVLHLLNMPSLLDLQRLQARLDALAARLQSHDYTGKRTVQREESAVRIANEGPDCDEQAHQEPDADTHDCDRQSGQPSQNG